MGADAFGVFAAPRGRLSRNPSRSRTASISEAQTHRSRSQCPNGKELGLVQSKRRAKFLLWRRLFVRTGIQIARQKIEGICPQRFGYSNELNDVQAPHSSFNFRNRSLINFQDCSQLMLAQPTILPRLNQEA